MLLWSKWMEGRQDTKLLKLRRWLLIHTTICPTEPFWSKVRVLAPFGALPRANVAGPTSVSIKES